MGLEMLHTRYDKLLEVGYGSGFLMPYWGTKAKEVYGLDQDAQPEEVSSHIKKASDQDFKLVQGSLLHMPYTDGFFDCVVAFSIMEHVLERKAAVEELHRVIRPGGTLLVGMPAVNIWMDLGFILIGFRNSQHHHVTNPSDFLDVAQKKFILRKRKTMFGLYYTFLLEKPLDQDL